MRNSAYAITPLANRRLQAQAEALAAAERRLAAQPKVETDEHEAAVHVAAEYTIYNEMRDHALYRALQAVQKLAGGIIQAVGRKKLG
jgi:hypothetical protein